MAPHPHRVVRRRQETADVVTLTLEPVGAPLARPAPGQFNMLYAFGVGDVPVSTSGDPTDDGPLVHTIRAVGPVTRALCRVRPDDAVGVRGPFGTGWGVPDAAASDLVLVAGGIGVAPLRPAVVQVLTERKRYRRVTLLVGARTPEDLPYRAELLRWRSRFDLDVDITVDVAGSEWRGHVGLVTKLLSRADFDPAQTVALVCGPEVMMRLAADALLDRGVHPGRVRISMERNMKCAIGLCGRCQFGPEFVCKDGPVFAYERVARLLRVREV
jgi:NAD(P)H-flavin reductase